MRKDMFKVIVERPRRGSEGWSRKGRARVLTDDDGAPIKAGRMAHAPRKERLDKTKYLNENLAPLARYIERQVNRPWNKVYSEICANLRTSSTVQQHVRDHIEDFVATRTRMEGGKVRCAWARFGSADLPLEEERRKFYVHPRTGLLRRNPHYRSWERRRREEEAQRRAVRRARLREIDKTTQLHKLKDDVWWEVKLAPKRAHLIEEDVVIDAGLSELPAHVLYGREGWRAIAKRVLSKADKKQHGLD